MEREASLFLLSTSFKLRETLVERCMCGIWQHIFHVSVALPSSVMGRGYGTRQRFARRDSRGNGKRGEGRQEQWVTGLQQNYIPTSDMNSIVTVWGVGCSSFPAKAS